MASPTKVQGHLCPTCDEYILPEGLDSSPESAWQKHSDVCFPEEIEIWLCPECETPYEDRDEAKECCT